MIRLHWRSSVYLAVACSTDDVQELLEGRALNDETWLKHAAQSNAMNKHMRTLIVS